MSYLRSILNNNKTNEVKYLKKLITYSKKLHLDTKRYEKELQKYEKIASKKIDTISKKSNYTIKSIKTYEDSIKIEFYHPISKKNLKFSKFKYPNRNKYIFDIKGNYPNIRKIQSKIKGIDKISITQYKQTTLRIILSNKLDLNPYYIINNKNIIIKIDNSKKEAPLKIKNLPKNLYLPKNYLHKQKVIVIDPGHGGKDVGAVGPNKRYEKHAVLKVSKYLYEILRLKGYKVYLTRTSDVFIKVHNRTNLSNTKKADIFISIHANAARKNRVKKAKGIEVFFLSPAKSERAKSVAATENRNNMRKMSYSSQNSLLTVLNQSKITQSNKLAIDIQKNILYSVRSKYTGIADGGVREGPFWVLVGAQMPSILIEIGYISHPLESKRLYSTPYQKLLANGISNGIDAYFSKN